MTRNLVVLSRCELSKMIRQLVSEELKMEEFLRIFFYKEIIDSKRNLRRHPITLSTYVQTRHEEAEIWKTGRNLQAALK